MKRSEIEGDERLARTNMIMYYEEFCALSTKGPHQVLNASGGDASRGHTRSHSEHDG